MRPLHAAWKYVAHVVRAGADMARRDDTGKLRGLASALGYELVKAPIRGCWFLVDEHRVHAVANRGTTAFGVDAAIKFLTNRKKAIDAD